MQNVFAECHKLPLFHKLGLDQEESRVKVLVFLRDELQNLPLAIRLFSHQLARGGVSLDDLDATLEKPGEDRSEYDERAAGRVHVRGFHFSVRCALESLWTSKATVHYCAALSLLSASGAPRWFVELVGVKQGFSKQERMGALSSLMNAGLVTIEDESAPHPKARHASGHSATR